MDRVRRRSDHLTAACRLQARDHRCSGAPAFGDLRDSRWAGVRTSFQLPAVLTTPANRARHPRWTAPPALSSTRSQSQRSSSQQSAAERCCWSSGAAAVANVG